MRHRVRIALPLLSAALLGACAGVPAKPADPLAGSAWRLERIEYMDDTTVTPDGARRYGIAFDAEGNVSIQADCNTLGGRYTYTPPSGLEFGMLRSTLAFCGEGSLYDRIRKDMPYVRSFVLKDGQLHVALMADGGIYRFSPAPRP
ncbi:MAG: META domain-containing protein [Arenimonas sp.]|nr:META domain-containing protein [Arenimonas sp.]